MIAILFLGLLFIWVYKFTSKYNVKPLPWLILIILAYPGGYYGFIYVANVFWPVILSEEWKHLLYPALAGFMVEAIVIVLLRISSSGAGSKVNKDEIID